MNPLGERFPNGSLSTRLCLSDGAVPFLLRANCNIQCARSLLLLAVLSCAFHV